MSLTRCRNGLRSRLRPGVDILDCFATSFICFGVMILARKCNINMYPKLANQTEIETSAVRTNVIFCVVAQVSDIYPSYRLPAEANTHACRASSDTW